MNTAPADHITAFIHNLLATHKNPVPLFIGLQGPQGCGKTTACNVAAARLQKEHNLRGTAISIDDFYLTHTEQVMLARRHRQNPYLQQRGYPGTHDIGLGAQTLANLTAINSSQQPVKIPRYDKSAHGGEGDRLPQGDWPIVMPPLDFVILEGWCLGFTPVTESLMHDKHLPEVNRLLRPYGEWYAFFDAFIQLKVSDIRFAIDWRIEAEKKMRAQGKAGMSDERIRAYIEGFMPAYELYLPGLKSFIATLTQHLVIDILRDRSARIAV
jgi:D-glycerate 3-kinase